MPIDIRHSSTRASQPRADRIVDVTVAGWPVLVRRPPLLASSGQYAALGCSWRTSSRVLPFVLYVWLVFLIVPVGLPNATKAVRFVEFPRSLVALERPEHKTPWAQRLRFGDQYRAKSQTLPTRCHIEVVEAFAVDQHIGNL